MTDKQIVQWDELEGIEDAFTKTILCPQISEKLGKEIYVKVRAIEATEFMAAVDIPMAEIDRLLAENSEPGAIAAAIQEQAKALGVVGLMAATESIIKIGLVEPVPSEGSLRKLSPDFDTIFQAVVELTMPPEKVEEAARFPADGE